MTTHLKKRWIKKTMDVTRKMKKHARKLRKIGRNSLVYEAVMLSCTTSASSLKVAQYLIYCFLALGTKYLNLFFFLIEIKMEISDEDLGSMNITG